MKISVFFRKHLVAVLLLIIGLYLVPISIYHLDFSKVPGDLVDARFNNYILEHGHKYLTGQVKFFWDAPFMHPYRNIVAFSDNLSGTLPVYTLFRTLGLDRETSFQWWLLILFVLNYVFCYYVLNRWSKNPVLSATGAYVFVFSIFNLGHITNVQVFPRFIMPLVFFWMWQYLREKQMKYFIGASLGVIYQFYCGVYLGFLLIYGLLFFTLAYFIVYRDWTLILQLDTRLSLKFMGIGLLGFILISPVTMPYVKASMVLGDRNFAEIFSSIPTLRSYFFATDAAFTWNILSHHAIGVIENFWAHCMFPGILPWLGLLLAVPLFFLRQVNAGRKQFLLFLVAVLFLSVIFCLNINGFTLYQFLFDMPGFSSMPLLKSKLLTI